VESLFPIFEQGLVVIVCDGPKFLGLITRIDVLNYLRRKLS
jgi:cystathionine beta-synthase